MSSEMPCGERTVRCLIGEEVDRIPYGVGIGWAPWGEAIDRWRAESGKPDLDVAREFGFDGSFTSPAFMPGIFPVFEPAVLEESERFIIHRDERGIVMRNRRDGGSMPEFIDHPVHNVDDWEQLKETRLQFSNPERISENWDVFRARIASTGEAVQVGWFPYGVFGTVRDLMGVEPLLLGFHDSPDLVHEMMNHLTGLWIDLWERVAMEVQIDHIHIWEDMSGRQGSLISPKMVRKFMMPCYDRIVDFGRSAGVRVISVDTDGDCSQLVPIFMEHGINMMFPFEVQAGNDILEFRRQYPDLGIMGGLDKRALAGKPEDVEEEVKKAAEMVALGRYIPGFDHLIPPDASWENYRYAALEMRKVCGLE